MTLTSLRRHLAIGPVAIALACITRAAHAASYSIPLAFNIAIAPPTCNLTVGDASTDAMATGGIGNTTLAQTAGNTINLTPFPYPIASSPNDIVSTLQSTTAISTDAPGVALMPGVVQQRKVSSMPLASAVCSPGVPMTASLHVDPSHLDILLIGGELFRPIGKNASGANLNIAMLMGLASFGNAIGATGRLGTTFGENIPHIEQTGTGLPQAIGMAGAMYASDSTPVGASRVGIFSYKFSLTLDF